MRQRGREAACLTYMSWQQMIGGYMICNDAVALFYLIKWWFCAFEYIFHRSMHIQCPTKYFPFHWSLKSIEPWFYCLLKFYLELFPYRIMSIVGCAIDWHNHTTGKSSTSVDSQKSCKHNQVSLWRYIMDLWEYIYILVNLDTLIFRLLELCYHVLSRKHRSEAFLNSRNYEYDYI